MIWRGNLNGRFEVFDLKSPTYIKRKLGKKKEGMIFVWNGPNLTRTLPIRIQTQAKSWPLSKKLKALGDKISHPTREGQMMCKKTHKLLYHKQKQGCGTKRRKKRRRRGFSEARFYVYHEPNQLVCGTRRGVCPILT